LTPAEIATIEDVGGFPCGTGSALFTLSSKGFGIMPPGTTPVQYISKELPLFIKAYTSPDEPALKLVLDGAGITTSDGIFQLDSLFHMQRKLEEPWGDNYYYCTCSQFGKSGKCKHALGHSISAGLVTVPSVANMSTVGGGAKKRGRPKKIQDTRYLKKPRSADPKEQPSSQSGSPASPVNLLSPPKKPAGGAAAVSSSAPRAAVVVVAVSSSPSSRALPSSSSSSSRATRSSGAVHDRYGKVTYYGN